MPDEVEIARVVREITVIEARLIAARHLKLADLIRLLESEKRRLETTLAEARADYAAPRQNALRHADLTGSRGPRREVDDRAATHGGEHSVSGADA